MLQTKLLTSGFSDQDGSFLQAAYPLDFGFDSVPSLLGGLFSIQLCDQSICLDFFLGVAFGVTPVSMLPDHSWQTHGTIWGAEDKKASTLFTIQLLWSLIRALEICLPSNFFSGVWGEHLVVLGVYSYLCTQGALPWAQGTLYGVPKIKPRLATCKAKTLPAMLSLSPSNSFTFYLLKIYS